MAKVHWGVLGCAKIGLEKVIPAMQAGKFCKVAAIASRDGGRAREAANRLEIGRAYGSYQQLLDDPQVEAVYIPLPNHLHVEWSKKALAAGKHVLCEKPVGMNEAEAGELLAAAAGYSHLKVMEAFMYRFHPQWEKTVEMVAGGAIGELRTIQSFFSYHNTDPANIRNRPEVGGGALMDIGCYCLSLSRLLFGREPERVSGSMHIDPAFGTDTLTSGILDFGCGTATFTCSTRLSPYQRVHIVGSEGRIELEIPFNAPPDKSCRLWLQKGPTIEEMVFAACDQYTLQADAFAQAVLNDSEVPIPLTDTRDNMRLIGRLRESVANGGWR